MLTFNLGRTKGLQNNKIVYQDSILYQLSRMKTVNVSSYEKRNLSVINLVIYDFEKAQQLVD